ncbi:unnamed protein product, partial [Iphiclides podalirius]
MNGESQRGRGPLFECRILRRLGGPLAGNHATFTTTPRHGIVTTPPRHRHDTATTAGRFCVMRFDVSSRIKLESSTRAKFNDIAYLKSRQSSS